MLFHLEDTAWHFPGRTTLPGPHGTSRAARHFPGRTALPGPHDTDQATRTSLRQVQDGLIKYRVNVAEIVRQSHEQDIWL